jgi:hypothetical protein
MLGDQNKNFELTKLLIFIIDITSQVTVAEANNVTTVMGWQ